MANKISGDNLLAHQAMKQWKSDTIAGDPRSANVAHETRALPNTDRADISHAHQRLSRQSEGVREAAIVTAEGARRQATLLKEMLTGSPAAAVKAHGGIDGNVFEAAMARPAA